MAHRQDEYSPHSESHGSGYGFSSRQYCLDNEPPAPAPPDASSNFSRPAYHKTDYASHSSMSEHISQSSKPHGRFSPPESHGSRIYKHDYIARPSTKDYITPDESSVTDRCGFSTPIRTSSTRSREYISPWDKSDHQMIKEGGWGNKKNFMESHGLDFYKQDSFEEAKDLLNTYRRLDAKNESFTKRMDEDENDQIPVHGGPGRRVTIYTPSSPSQDRGKNDSGYHYENRSSYYDDNQVRGYNRYRDRGYYDGDDDDDDMIHDTNDEDAIGSGFNDDGSNLRYHDDQLDDNYYRSERRGYGDGY